MSKPVDIFETVAAAGLGVPTEVVAAPVDYEIGVVEEDVGFLTDDEYIARFMGAMLGGISVVVWLIHVVLA